MEPREPQATVQPMTMPSPSGEANNGQSGNGASHGEDHGDSENKHVSWLVGGPRRARRPVRNWRDRA